MKKYWLIVVKENAEVGIGRNVIAVETDINNPEELCYRACSTCVLENEEYAVSYAVPSTKDVYDYFKENNLPNAEVN